MKVYKKIIFFLSGNVQPEPKAASRTFLHSDCFFWVRLPNDADGAAFYVRDADKLHAPRNFSGANRYGGIRDD
jgi:hypothetical protein